MSLYAQALLTADLRRRREELAAHYILAGEPIDKARDMATDIVLGLTPERKRYLNEDMLDAILARLAEYFENGSALEDARASPLVVPL
jgi:hypothetical protein